MAEVEESPSGSTGDAGSSSVPPSDSPSDGAAPGERRKPRKIFLLVGVVIAVALGIGLFTGIGTSTSTSGKPYAGGPAPTFTATNVGPTGGSHVTFPLNGTDVGRPVVLLFFGAWCPSCHQELPPLARAVKAQSAAGGKLAAVKVIGVDDLDSPSSARSFIASAGVTFPVAYDPNTDITQQKYGFDGDPYAVFIKSDGTIAKIVEGAVLTPSSLAADERALIPSGR
ncbi:MAG TPA: TlpA disulfide reductase family protein [Acidimicrobiales bacterium]|nr:TlpA disulfide reductase family protein [Acidimicrobiales bacterium]